MDLNTIATVAHDLGLDNAVAVLLAVLTLARALDAFIKQPAPGSHWLPLRKMVSVIAFSVLHAKPGEQPPLVTWLQRLVVMLAQAVPPQARVEPSLVRPAPLPPAVRPAAPAAPVAPAGSITPAGSPSLMEQARSVLGSAPTDTATFRRP